MSMHLIWTPLLLALVAAVGYLIGRRARRPSQPAGADTRRELRRAHAVIRELEGISQRVRANLTRHHSSVTTFKRRVEKLDRLADGESWRELTEEAERILKPTLQLSTEIAAAYDEIRQQTNYLMTFTEVRTDPLTGLRNRRALDECLDMQFSMSGRYGVHFAVAIFDVDHFKRVNDDLGHLEGDHVLQAVARLLDDVARDTDTVARFGGEEFVVLMPETDLAGASVFAERARHAIASRLSVTVSGGVAQATSDDNPRTLISRADGAMYAAKSAGRNLVFHHDGERLRRVTSDETSEPDGGAVRTGRGGDSSSRSTHRTQQRMRQRDALDQDQRGDTLGSDPSPENAQQPRVERRPADSSFRTPARPAPLPPTGDGIHPTDAAPTPD